VTFNILTLISYNFLLTIYNLNFLNLFIFIIRQIFQKSFFSNKKAPQQKAKGLEIDKLPLLETFGTFCWGKIIEELRNTYNLKELINLPVSVINPI
jgi:hypothetical protein